MRWCYKKKHSYWGVCIRLEVLRITIANHRSNFCYTDIKCFIVNLSVIWRLENEELKITLALILYQLSWKMYSVLICESIFNNNLELEIDIYEWVNNFKYLGTFLKSWDNMKKEILIRNLNANKIYLSNISNSKVISRKIKTHIYKSLIQSFLTHSGMMQIFLFCYFI